MSFSVSRTIVVFMFCLLSYESGLASSDRTLQQQVFNHLEASVNQFLRGYLQATHSITLRPQNKSPEACSGPLRIENSAAHKPPMGAVRLSVTCPSQWEVYFVADVDIQLLVAFSRQALARGDVLAGVAMESGLLNETSGAKPFFWKNY